MRRSNGFCESDGERVYWESVGAGDPPLVLCHGAGGNHAVWYQQVPVFGRHRRVITWDHRGFGRSSARGGPTSPAAAVRDLRAVLAAAGVSGPIDLVGQSMGGWTALGFALAEPARVRRLVLADTPGGIMTPELGAALRGLGRGPLAPDGVLGRHPALGASLVHRDPARAWTLALLASELHVSRSHLAESFTRLVGQPPIHYLSRWRLQLAARLLSESTAKVATIAHDVGYGSEAAFSRAFKRFVGVAPATWRARSSATS